MDNTHQNTRDEKKNHKSGSEQHIVLVTEETDVSKRENKLHKKNETLQEEVLTLKNAWNLTSERESHWKKKYLDERSAVEKLQSKNSTLKSAGCEEWIATSFLDYEAIASKIASEGPRDIHKREALRKKIQNIEFQIY